MKAALVRPALVPALVLCAALTAAAAWAGEEPVAPFPGTSVSGARVSGTSVPGPRVSGTSVPGAAVEGRQESFPERAPEASSEAAPNAGDEVPGAAAPAVDAGASEAPVPDGTVAGEKPATPLGGSRLLRALAEAPKAPASLDDGAAGGVAGEAARPGSPRIFAAEGCPRALLRRLLAGAAGAADALSALGIEREILTLCRERQEIVAGLFEAEARLGELREAGRAPELEPQVRAPSAAPAPEANRPVVEAAARSPLRAAPGGAAENANEADTRAGDTRAGEVQGNALVRAPARVSPAQVSPRYAWFSIIGTAGALRAGVTDGTGVWFVREGDPLPGGARIAAIAGRPPGVRVTGAGESGEATLLPFRARPGGSP